MRDQYMGVHMPQGATNKFTYTASFKTSGDKIIWSATVVLDEKSWHVNGDVAMITGLANVDPLPIVHREVKAKIDQIVL